MAMERSSSSPAASLPGPAREIVVEPLEAPVEQPAPVEPRREEPAVPPEREREPEPASR
jgi:hypothetical protein